MRYYYKTTDGKGLLNLKSPATIDKEVIKVSEDGVEYIDFEKVPNPDYIEITEAEFRELNAEIKRSLLNKK